ncbi:MAG: choice-of-anchor tandem repeat GloVer-containing protein, partial [Capsulimonadaceae bacterium]
MQGSHARKYMLPLVVLLALCLIPVGATRAQALYTLHSFTGLDGVEPAAGLALGTDGNFYGTTAQGGANGDGSIFMITPGGAIHTLYSFTGPDGDEPEFPLTPGNGGFFYGTTEQGGAYGYGTLFKFLPYGLNGIFEGLITLYSFSGPDGEQPVGGLVAASDGNVYGTTNCGGASYTSGNPGDGTVFMITPDDALTTLYSFSGPDGQYPNGLVQGTDGNFYGTTTDGGSGNGVVFEITAAGALTDLYSFGAASTDGQWPDAGLVQGTDGNFYGTTEFGGAASDGTVFQVTPGGVLTTLISFTGTNGDEPQADLVQGSNGNLYGTTAWGGAFGDGSAFDVTPAGELTTLHSFDGVDGVGLEGSLVQGDDGNYYGTTCFGGGSDLGTVFALVSGPAPPGSLTATGGGDQVSLAWTASPGATSYNVYCGTASGEESPTPVETGLTGPTAIVANFVNPGVYYFTVTAVNASGTSLPSNEASAIPAFGTPFGWGDNEYGELGNGTSTNSDLPVQALDFTDAASVAAGGYHCLALQPSGAVWAWGENSDGQLGNAGTTGADVPVAVSSSTGLTSATAIAAGLYHSLAIQSGDVWAWGW